MTESARNRGVPYIELHELLEENGYELIRSRTDCSETGVETLFRVYSPADGLPPAKICFPVQGRMVLYEHYIQIKEILEQRDQNSQ